MKTILITGINGFLGSNLAKAFSTDHRIVGLEYSLKNLDRIKDFNFKTYSVENGIPDEVFTEQNIDFIVHTATFYGRQNESADIIARANLFIPLQLLEKVINYKCKLFINSDTVLDRYVNTYALSKRHFQEWLYLRRNEIKIINMQLEHFYGPGASNANFLTHMIRRLKNNEASIDLTLGEQKRGFVYIEDVVSAYKLVFDKAKEISDPFTEFHVTASQLISIKDLMLLLKKLLKSESVLNFGAVDYRENELFESITDSKALIKLGWRPNTELYKGLEYTILSELKIKK
jgi:nucleoside-diphosphate-sugar epimerase